MSVDDDFDDLERRMADLLEEETKRAADSSFTKEQMVKHLDGADMLNSFIRGHLYFEHILVQAITEALVVPSEIDLRRLSFPSKLDLALSMGLLPKEYRRIGTVLNELRNKVAHRLDFEFGDDHRKVVWNALPREVQISLLNFKSLPGEEYLDVHIHLVLVGLLMTAENHRKHAAYTRAQSLVAQQHLKEAVELARPGMEARGLIGKKKN